MVCELSNLLWIGPMSLESTLINFRCFRAFTLLIIHGNSPSNNFKIGRILTIISILLISVEHILLLTTENQKTPIISNEKVQRYAPTIITISILTMKCGQYPGNPSSQLKLIQAYQNKIINLILTLLIKISGNPKFFNRWLFRITNLTETVISIWKIQQWSWIIQKTRILVSVRIYPLHLSYLKVLLLWWLVSQVLEERNLWKSIMFHHSKLIILEIWNKVICWIRLSISSKVLFLESLIVILLKIKIITRILKICYQDCIFANK